MNPKVFISHSTADKERFVTNFAQRLRKEKGVDAWLDEWEMLPGDSLVDKIFEEGIKNAEAIIVVLSNNSINSKWAKEEMNAGFIKKVNEKSKLIPVIIDDCEIPECIKYTIWIKIKSLNNYDVEFKDITNSIFRIYDKPDLGNVPDYTKIKPIKYFNLSDIDNFVFEKLCDKLLENPFYQMLQKEFINSFKQYDINIELFNESLLALKSKNIIDTSSFTDGTIYRFKINDYALTKYLEIKFKNINEIKNRIISEIINSEVKTDDALSTKLSIPRILVRTILINLANKRLITTTEVQDGTFIIIQYSPLLKREI